MLVIINSQTMTTLGIAVTDVWTRTFSGFTVNRSFVLVGQGLQWKGARLPQEHGYYDSLSAAKPPRTDGRALGGRGGKSTLRGGSGTLNMVHSWRLKKKKKKKNRMQCGRQVDVEGSRWIQNWQTSFPNPPMSLDRSGKKKKKTNKPQLRSISSYKATH